MVIGESFAWAHIPKTGGDAVLAMFRLFPTLILQAHHTGTHAKHEPFTARAAQVSGKVLALNIRRLPSWLLSHAQHEAHFGLYPHYKPLPLPSPAELADRPSPDLMLAFYTDGGRIKIDHWLRTEYLPQDFMAFLLQFTAIANEHRHKVQGLGMVNAMTYNHDIRHWFTREQVAQMYTNNPRWTSVEQAAYGDTLLDVWAD
jgi:hypothetical protein